MPKPPVAATDRFVTVAGYRVHYIDAGRGTPVILIPGSYSTCRAWDRLVPLLAADYRLLAVDYVGTGESDKPTRGFGYTAQEQADIVAGMIEQLALAPAHLVGASYGGVIVLLVAAGYPQHVAKVVSIEGSAVVPEKLPGSPLESMLKYPILGDMFIALVRTGWLSRPLLKTIAGAWYPHMTAADRQEMLEQLAYNARSAARIPWYRVSVAHKHAVGLEALCQTIRAPVLYLYGEQSDFRPMVDANLRFFEAHLPHVQAAELPGGIHDLAFQKPLEVAVLIRRFFLGQPETRGESHITQHR
jgi:pimeloyl-ACP methyl ester carboxylesterase